MDGNYFTKYVCEEKIRCTKDMTAQHQYRSGSTECVVNLCLLPGGFGPKNPISSDQVHDSNAFAGVQAQS